MTRRISLAMTLLTGLLVIVMSIPLVLVFRAYQYDRLSLGLERDALVIASDLSSLPPAQWPALVNNYESRTGVRVTVVDAKSNVLTDSEGAAVGSAFQREEMAKALSGSIASGVRYSATLDTQLRYVSVPIKHGDEVLGAVRLSVPETEVQQDVRALVYALLTILAVVLLAAMLAAWGVARALSRPLARLADGAERVGEDPTARVGSVKGPHEIQNVADALDETAEKLDAMLDRSRAVAADASHHLRTPLAAMRLRLETISDTADDPAIADQADAALVEVDRLARRVDQVLAIATAETAAELVVVDVGECANARALDWQGLASDRGVDLLCDYGSARVQAPIGEVERILDELVGNALDYAESRVTISVDVIEDGEPDGNVVVLLVRDDGPGIPVDEREAVFSRFQRGSQAVPGGTGLGLALVRQAANASGGQVRVVDSEGGACFEVKWPAAPGVEPQ